MHLRHRFHANAATVAVYAETVHPESPHYRVIISTPDKRGSGAPYYVAYERGTRAGGYKEVKDSAALAAAARICRPALHMESAYHLDKALGA